MFFIKTSPLSKYFFSIFIGQIRNDCVQCKDLCSVVVLWGRFIIRSSKSFHDFCRVCSMYTRPQYTCEIPRLTVKSGFRNNHVFIFLLIKLMSTFQFLFYFSLSIRFETLDYSCLLKKRYSFGLYISQQIFFLLFYVSLFSLLIWVLFFYTLFKHTVSGCVFIVHMYCDMSANRTRLAIFFLRFKYLCSIEA